MSIKEKLENVKELLLSHGNKDYSDEFDAVLEDQLQEEKEFYRFRYINYYREFNHDNYNNNFAIQDIKLDTFTIPNGFTHEDAIDVLSYLSDYLEEKLDLAENTYRSIEVINNILDNKDLQFSKVIDNIDENEIEDLFLVVGRLALFKESQNYKKYFNWRKKGITKEKVEEIYNKIGIEFNELKLFSEEENKILLR